MCVVFCVFFLLPVVFAASNQPECIPDERANIIATINEGDRPYWYQMYVGKCLQGKNIADIPVSKLQVHKAFHRIEQISNFPLLNAILLDNTEMTFIPVLKNLPNIEKISLARNRLREIRNGQFGDIPVKEIFLSRNSITDIGSSAFGYNTEKIYLTCNNISTLSPTWFKNTTSIKLLKLGGNQIESIPDNMFKDFVNLVDLELRNNQIKTLGIGSISGPRYMDLLHLGYNQISEIRAEVFGPVINITRFNVEYNRISFLHQAMMEKMSARYILLWANPWQCPCQKFIDAWISKNNRDFSQGLARDEDPSCVTALSFRNVCVPFVDDDLYETFLMNFDISPFQLC